MRKIERIIVILAIIILLLNIFLTFPGVNALLILLMGFLSLLYFVFSFALFNGLRLRDLFKKDKYSNLSALKILGAVGTGISLSITVIAILFKVMFWPGSKVNMIVGLFSLLVNGIIAFIKYSKIGSGYYSLIIQRSVLFGGLALILLLIPNQTLAEIKFRNEPEFRDALIDTMNNPDDIEAQEIFRKESQKREGI